MLRLHRAPHLRQNLRSPARYAASEQPARNRRGCEHGKRPPALGARATQTCMIADATRYVWVEHRAGVRQGNPSKKGNRAPLETA